MNIALIGFMGSGKTTVGELLAKKLQMQFVETDEEIVKREGKSIPDIFSEKGEPYFRDIEKKVIAEVSANDNQIISCGGGVVLNKENIIELKKNSVVILLDVSLDVAWERVQENTNRPLARNKVAFTERYSQRASIYKDATDIHVNGDGNAEEVLEEILSILKSIGFLNFS